MHPYLKRGPNLFVLSGPSGVGKDAMLNQLRLSGLPAHFTVTATTRLIRPSEREGVDYIFLTRATFDEMRTRNEFLECAEVYGNWYGVPKAQVQQALQMGRDVLIKTDVQGAATIKRLAPQAVMVFVAPPSLHELERRLRWRLTEPEDSLNLRLDTARREMDHLPAFDYVVVNDKLDEAVRQLACVITAERCRIPPRQVKL